VRRCSGIDLIEWQSFRPDAKDKLIVSAFCDVQKILAQSQTPRGGVGKPFFSWVPLVAYE